MKPNIVGLALAVGVVAVAAAIWPRQGEPDVRSGAPVPGGEMVAVSMPALSGEAVLGQKVFAVRCAECHGTNAGGVEGAGPPLVHVIYEPNHHADAAIFLAAERGVRAHHWRFGDMPPVENISRAEIATVVAFLRQVQRENGIF